jgi:type III secretory pathway component EscS
MTESFQHQLYEGMRIMALAGLPVLGLALVLGLVIGVLQAATQVQEQTFPQIAKILMIGLMLYLFGASLSQPLVRYTETAFSFAARR